MATMMDVPESQRLIALSLGKIAASRGQKGGINLHKNLLVATVLTKARAAYMIQHMNAAKQRTVQPAAPATSHSPQQQTSSTCVEMKDAKPEPASTGSSAATTTASTTSSATSSAVSVAPPSSHSPSPGPVPAAPQSVTPQTDTAWVPDGAAGSRTQVASEAEDKENTPPPSSPCRGDATTSPSFPSQDCEKRLQGEPCVDIVKEGKPTLSSRSAVSHGQQSNTTTATRSYVSRPSSTCCLLKRRRAMDKEHENVSAPKVRIVDARVSDTGTSPGPEPMQCDSPQISNLVNIFNTSFSGLSGASSSSSSSSSASGEVSVRSVGQSILSSVSSHKLSDNNLTCAKEMTKVGLDSLHHPLVLSV